MRSQIAAGSFEIDMRQALSLPGSSMVSSWLASSGEFM